MKEKMKEMNEGGQRKVEWIFNGKLTGRRSFRKKKRASTDWRAKGGD